MNVGDMGGAEAHRRLASAPMAQPPPRAGRGATALLIGALVLLNFPLLAIVEALRQTWPYATAIYLFASWLGIIVATACVAERR